MEELRLFKIPSFDFIYFQIGTKRAIACRFLCPFGKAILRKAIFAGWSKLFIKNVCQIKSVIKHIEIHYILCLKIFFSKTRIW